jgi:phosphomannomutase
MSKAAMTKRLTESAPASIGGVKVAQVENLDGVKYVMADDAWLLIRPSGTEPVLRVYAEAGQEEMVAALLAFGQKMAEMPHP